MEITKEQLKKNLKKVLKEEIEKKYFFDKLYDTGYEGILKKTLTDIAKKLEDEYGSKERPNIKKFLKSVADQYNTDDYFSIYPLIDKYISSINAHVLNYKEMRNNSEKKSK